MNRSDYTITIGPIINLADARFYAAFEFDYLLFDFREDSPSKVSLELFTEIKDWLTGVEFIAISETQIEGISKCISGKELDNLLKVEPQNLNKLTTQNFVVDISNMLNEPIKHYDLVADWMEAKFDL